MEKSLVFKKKFKTILVTGSAGFIGFSLSKKLLDQGICVIGIDNQNNYYDPKLKSSRLRILKNNSNYYHHKIDISNKNKLSEIFQTYKIESVINLAAQAGVRYSIDNPLTYVNSNILGFLNILENCRDKNIKHLVYASTSSVYGANTKTPFSEHDCTNHPLSIYSASKKSNELMAHTYSYLFKLPTTGLRFFTVYGPWGRPDMALFKFTKNIIENKEIDVFNYGKHSRDFTYIEDIVSGLCKTINNPARSNAEWNSNYPDPATSNAPWRIYNIGNNKPIKLMDYIKALEIALKKKAQINYLPLQKGDVLDTHADITDLKRNFNYKPSTSVIEGVANFVKWFRQYYKI